MRVIVTCGPSYEPIDDVRRITNFSTGELGVTLSNVLADHGHEVICFKGVGATYSNPKPEVKTLPFTTNDSLEDALEGLDKRCEIGGVFHVAALCDFRVRHVSDADGVVQSEAKISSRAGALLIALEPARKLIGRLRHWFPQSAIVGWKYELNGLQESAIDRAIQQLEENQIDACVLNGRAYGEGFGFCRRKHPLQHVDSKDALCVFLAKWLARFPIGS